MEQLDSNNWQPPTLNAHQMRQLTQADTTYTPVVEQQTDAYTPVAPADYTAYIGRIAAAIGSKTTKATQSAWLVCGFGVALIGFWGYQFDMFRFQLRYHAPERAAAAAVAQASPKTTPKTSARLQASPTLTTTAPTVTPNSKLSFSLQPAEVSEMPEPNVRKFIEKWTAIAVQEMDAHGIPASVTMAQGIIESRSGCSILSQPLTFAAFDGNKVLRQGCNNFFGVKCAKGNGCPVGHCANHMDDIAKDFFVKYATPEASWRGHSEFLKKNGYVALAQALGAGPKDYKTWIAALCRKGYATDPNYGKKLLDIISRYNLSTLDDL